MDSNVRNFTSSIMRSPIDHSHTRRNIRFLTRYDIKTMTQNDFGRGLSKDRWYAGAGLKLPQKCRFHVTSDEDYWSLSKAAARATTECKRYIFIIFILIIFDIFYGERGRPLVNTSPPPLFLSRRSDTVINFIDGPDIYRSMSRRRNFRAAERRRYYGEMAILHFQGKAGIYAYEVSKYILHNLHLSPLLERAWHLISDYRRLGFNCCRCRQLSTSLEWAAYAIYRMRMNRVIYCGRFIIYDSYRECRDFHCIRRNFERPGGAAWEI